MILAIPSHLTNLKIIDQMQKMLVDYYSDNNGLPDDGMNSYFEDKAYDYIKELFSIIFVEQDEAISNYLVNLFYECKGTTKIFDLMEKYLDVEYLTQPKYDIDTLVINFKVVKGTDITRFKPALENFLNSLLYFDEIKIAIDVFKLYVTSNIFNKSANNCIYYKESYFEFK